MDLTPRGLFDLARSTVETAVSVPGRVLGLLEAAEQVVRRADDLIGRTGRVLDETEALVDRAGAVIDHTEALMTRAGAVAAAAEQVTTDAGHTARTSRELVDNYAPLAHRAHPLASRFVDELSAHEVDAAIELVDQLPVLTKHLINDVLPIMSTLDRVGPDIHQLLEVTNDVRQAILGIPGFTFLRRRGEDKEERGEVPEIDA